MYVNFILMKLPSYHHTHIFKQLITFKEIRFGINSAHIYLKKTFKKKRLQSYFMNYRTLVPLLHSYSYFCNGITKYNYPCCDSVINFDEKSNFLLGKEFVHTKNMPKKILQT